MLLPSLWEYAWGGVEHLQWDLLDMTGQLEEAQIWSLNSITLLHNASVRATKYEKLSPHIIVKLWLQNCVMCLVSLKYTMVCFQFLERARGYNDIEFVTCIYFYFTFSIHSCTTEKEVSILQMWAQLNAVWRSMCTNTQISYLPPTHTQPECQPDNETIYDKRPPRNSCARVTVEGATCQQNAGKPEGWFIEIWNTLLLYWPCYLTITHML